MNEAHTLSSMRARVLSVLLIFISPAPALKPPQTLKNNRERKWQVAGAASPQSILMLKHNASFCLNNNVSWIRINCNCYVRGHSLLTQIRLAKDTFL